MIAGGGFFVDYRVMAMPMWLDLKMTIRQKIERRTVRFSTFR
tara:strand:- start:308 stop:433 length:126 start_codon:yes stop_codon:yes gene_type:complete